MVCKQLLMLASGYFNFWCCYFLIECFWTFGDVILFTNVCPLDYERKADFLTSSRWFLKIVFFVFVAYFDGSIFLRKLVCGQSKGYLASMWKTMHVISCSIKRALIVFISAQAAYKQCWFNFIKPYLDYLMLFSSVLRIGYKLSVWY